MTDDELARVVALLADSHDALESLVAGLSEADWHVRPGPDAWSPVEVLEHLAITERSVRTLVTERLPARRAVADDRRSAVRDDDVVRVTESRARRFASPEGVRPRGSAVAPADLLAAIEADRAAVVRYANDTTDDLRARTAPHPVAGVLDAYQWLLFLGAHTRRHVEQIADIRRSGSIGIDD
ncbi:MAG TPA: DinB family protein [Vicinamibacterales bacterium]|nr:DinB family protein [Vicinamibacterales bacterium]